jgi:CrcB protein
MSALAAFCVFVGGGIGACLRWGLSLLLNPLSQAIPLGTLAANLVGGYLIGVAAAFFALKGGLASELRLFAVTGILGGFTTFSAFSNEVVSLLGQGRLGWAAATVAAHVFGSLALTMLGIMTVRMFAHSLA